MKTAIWAVATTLVATLSVACADRTVERQTTVTRESTGYSPPPPRTYMDESPTRSNSTTTVEHADGSRSTVEERTYVAPDGTTTRKSTTTTVQ